MNSTEFRAAIERMHLTQSGFARLLARLGDDRPPQTILRTVSMLAKPDREMPVPWSVAVLMRALEEGEFAQRETYNAIRRLVLDDPAPALMDETAS